MVNISDVPAAGTPSSPQHSGNTPAITAQLRTNSAEQVQANNVEKIQPEGSSIAERRAAQDERARINEIYTRRPTQAREEKRAVNEEVAEAAAAAQRAAAAANAAAHSQSRDGAVAGGPNRVDVSA
jgi:hypothetical protein